MALNFLSNLKNKTTNIFNSFQRNLGEGFEKTFNFLPSNLNKKDMLQTLHRIEA